MASRKFIVDINVGKLTPWLRALGYDTLFINPIADAELVRIASRDNRTIVTKDTGIFKRRVVVSGEVKAFLVEGKDWRLWLHQVVSGLKLTTDRQFTRCLECNTVLEECSRQDARPHVPVSVYGQQHAFVYCRCCARYYWQGSHFQRMTRVLGDAFRNEGR